MTLARLAVAVILIAALPGAGLAACLKSRGTPLRTDDEITQEYLRCRHAEEVEALKGKGPVQVAPTDELRVEEGAVPDYRRRNRPFEENQLKLRQNLDSMGDVNTRMGDELKLLQPRRITP